ncbi:hypothetical protein RJ45_15080 [Photobacterium gaetbulicola]|uniref:Uncharacterized protein n=1 Tax=Photobacterium gaetbulicola TaxID=1295392 RepID=A0A0B9H1Y4_9GAMM|nr:hypothetical protein [Photobacterium gaetbulicola]KHT62822.1 hypothetical protein RJ45_15080 [Photobacterium gaetbulicola]
MSNYLKSIKLLVACFFITIIATGCNSGSSNDTKTNNEQWISGTAAIGAPLSGTLTVKGSNNEIIQATINNNGSFQVDLNDPTVNPPLTPPYRLYARGIANGETYEQHSYLDAFIEGEDNIVNVTPFTDIIVSRAAGELAAIYFARDDANDLSTVELKAQEQMLREVLKPVFEELGVDISLNLMSSAFEANNTGLDSILDAIETNQNHETLTVELTNKLTQQNIEISLTDPKEELPAFDPALPEISDAEAIANLFQSFNEQFADSAPSANQLTPLFADSFLNNDVGRNTFFSYFADNDEMIGLTLTPDKIHYINEGEALIFVLIGNEEDASRIGWWDWYLVRNAQGWQFDGNRAVVNWYFDFHCHSNNHLPTGFCEINIGIEDLDLTNSPKKPGWISSAKAYSQLDGEIVPGSIVYFSELADGQPGELHSYNTNDGSFNEDVVHFSWLSAEAFGQGQKVVIEIYAEPINLDVWDNPQVVGEPEQILTEIIFAEAKRNSAGENIAYPEISTNTLERLKQYNGGELLVEWSLPEGQLNAEVMLSIYNSEQYLSSSMFTWFNSDNNATLNLDTTNLPAGDYTLELRVYADDSEYEQQTYSYFHYEEIVLP